MKTLITTLCILFLNTAFAQDKMIVHTVTVDNIQSNWTVIDHPDLNNNPNACLNFVQRYIGGSVNDKATGIWYDSVSQKWIIYNEDLTNMPEDIAFNILISDPDNCIDHIVTPENSIGNVTTIDNPQLNNNNPGPFMFISKMYNPNFVYNNNQFGIFYDSIGEKRAIYEEGLTTMIQNAAFKVMLPPNGDGNTLFSHTSISDNINGNATILDHPLLNDNPDAAFLFIHYWGITGPDTQIYLDANLEADYFNSIGRWVIYSNGVNFPEGVAFDILVREPEVLNVADVSINTTSYYPNPSKGPVTIKSSIESINDIVIYDILGRKVDTFEGNNTLEQNITISNLKAGMYLLKISTANSSKTLKIIKE